MLSTHNTIAQLNWDCVKFMRTSAVHMYVCMYARTPNVRSVLVCMYIQCNLLEVPGLAHTPG